MIDYTKTKDTYDYFITAMCVSDSLWESFNDDYSLFVKDKDTDVVFPW